MTSYFFCVHGTLQHPHPTNCSRDLGVGRLQCNFCTLESAGNAVQCQGAMGIGLVGDIGQYLYIDTFGVLYDTLKYLSGMHRHWM